MRITLTAIQYKYVQSNLSKEEVHLFKKLNEGKTDKTSFELDGESAFKIRDWAGDKLQQLGFDQYYQLTDDGKILEGIIDVLYE